MNERIEELAKIAVEYAAEQYGPQRTGEKVWDPYTYDKKFAELIIWECIRMCDIADISLLEHNRVKEADGTQCVKELIREHFGVEE